MENNNIKKILQENLKNPNNEDFNNQIIKKLDLAKKKRHRVLFDEKSILRWFLVISGFVIFFYLQQESKSDTIAILIGGVISAIPLYLLIFNKIYSIKNNL